MKAVHFRAYVVGLLLVTFSLSVGTNSVAAGSPLRARRTGKAPGRNPSSTSDLAIITPSLRDATVGAKYEAQILALDSGKASYRWTIKAEKGSKLPPGLKVVQGVCSGAPCKPSVTIAGTPQKTGEFIIVATVEAGKAKVSKTLSLRILDQTPAPSDLTIITPSLRDGAVGREYKTQVYARDSGKVSYRWTVKGENGGPLPPGLNAAQGRCGGAPCKTSVYIAGTPRQSGEFTIVATVEAGGPKVSKTFTLRIR
jgi:hypothetical protein